MSFWDIAERLVPVLRAGSPRTRVVVDTVDLHFRRMAREAELLGDPGKRAEAEAVRVRELAVYGSADVVLAVSEDEQEVICELLPGTPVGLLPTVHHALAQPQSPGGRRGALFVGSYGHAPNVDAVRFLCDEVLPQLRGLGSDAAVAVAGYAMPDELAAFARERGAEVLGFLPGGRGRAGAPAALDRAAAVRRRAQGQGGRVAGRGSPRRGHERRGRRVRRPRRGHARCRRRPGDRLRDRAARHGRPALAAALGRRAAR